MEKKERKTSRPQYEYTIKTRHALHSPESDQCHRRLCAKEKGEEAIALSLSLSVISLDSLFFMDKTDIVVNSDQFTCIQFTEILKAFENVFCNNWALMSVM